MLQFAALDPLAVDEGAAFAADIDEEVAVVFVADLGVLARDGVVEHLQIVLGLAPDGKDGFAERDQTLDSKPVGDTQLRRLLHRPPRFTSAL
ncbi:hypothetical protein D3C83_63590 [compost metagenome]